MCGLVTVCSMTWTRGLWAQLLGQELLCGLGPGSAQISTFIQSSLTVGNLTASKGSGTFYK